MQRAVAGYVLPVSPKPKAADNRSSRSRLDDKINHEKDRGVDLKSHHANDRGSGPSPIYHDYGHRWAR